MVKHPAPMIELASGQRARWRLRKRKWPRCRDYCQQLRTASFPRRPVAREAQGTRALKPGASWRPARLAQPAFFFRLLECGLRHRHVPRPTWRPGSTR